MRASRTHVISTILLHLFTLTILSIPLLSQDPFVAASSIHRTEQHGISPQQHNARFHTNQLRKRADVPSTDAIVAMIDRTGKVGKKPSIFWTGFYDYPGPTAYFTVVKWGNQKFGRRCDFYLYTDLLANKDYEAMNSRTLTTQEKSLQIAHLSKAFARRSKGTVYVLIPEGREPHETSVWRVWEAPVLTRRPDWCDEIVRVDFPSGKESTIWKKGDAALYKESPPGKL